MITYVIILVAVLALGIPSIYLVIKLPKTRPFFMVVYLLLIVLFGYLLFRNINKPIKFERELDLRTKVTVERLKDIRTIQLAYKDKYNKYGDSFDKIIDFIKTDSFEIPKLEIIGKWDQDVMTKEEALNQGIIVKSSSFSPVKDSLWKDKLYDIEDIRYVPFADTNQLVIGAGEVETASLVKVKVFECYVLYKTLLNGLDEQLIINYIDEKTKYGGFEGIKVGSLTEATNNAGNWEQ